MRGINLFRTVMFLPSVLSGVAVAVLWVALLNPDLGAVNGVLRGIGISNPPRWLDSPTWAMPSVVLIGLWGIGGGAIIYLAGLQNISAQFYEAALIDGASPWQRFRYVTLPMITPTLLFVLLTSLIDAFQVFDIAYVLGGAAREGRETRSSFYLINLWNVAFVVGRLGYASALAWVIVLAAAVIIVVIFRTSGDGSTTSTTRTGHGEDMSTRRGSRARSSRRVRRSARRALPDTQSLLHDRDLRDPARPHGLHPAAGGLDVHRRTQAGHGAHLHCANRVVPHEILELGQLQPCAHRDDALPPVHHQHDDHRRRQHPRGAAVVLGRRLCICQAALSRQWLLFTLLIITMLIPWQALMVPQFLIFYKIGWYGTYLPLIIPSFGGSAFFIFLIRQYMRTIPRDLDDAARVDGLSTWQIFRYIILPLSTPVLTVCAVFTFLGSWNNLLGPLIYLDSDRTRSPSRLVSRTS